MNLKLSRSILFFSFVILASLTACNNKTFNEKMGATGYKPFAYKDPFYLFVKDQYPSDQSMMLISESNPQIVFRLDNDAKNRVKRAVVSIKTDMDVGIQLSPDNSPQEMFALLSLPGQPSQMLRDINCDGIWDIKIIPVTMEKFIFKDGQWMRVNEIKGFCPNISAESSQGTFIFDMKKGQWIKVNSTSQP